MIPAWLTRGKRASPTLLLMVWFFLLLLIGTALLLIPCATRNGAPALDWLSALFTAASAFCVTGLTVVDTAETFSLFGQVVILVLIELGGLGIMTFAHMGMTIMGRRMSLIGQVALADSLFQQDAIQEFKTVFRTLLISVTVIQITGAVLLFLSLLSRVGHDGWAFTLWSAIFHSVSAFCNAGFAIYPRNLEPLGGNYFFLTVIMGLVVLGGLGHTVLAELWRWRALLRLRHGRTHLFSLHTRVVLTVTAVLLVTGAVLVCTSDILYGSAGSVFDSVFHSVVARTAGFNSQPLGQTPLPSCLLLCLLMFIGGSPGSCAGGIKTTSLAIWLARISANLRHDPNVTLLGRTIRQDLVVKARLIMALSTLWVIVGVMLLSLFNPDAELRQLLFEQISALATVGLSLDFTHELDTVSRLWIILSMIMGKFGPLTIALWVAPACRPGITRPEGRVLVG